MIAEFRDTLLHNGISPTFQRLMVYKYLKGTKSHPTVQQVYKSLKEEIPSLSMTTVYNVLNLLVEKKLAIQVRIEDNELRFDADVSEHAHFRCITCDQVSDIFFKNSLEQFIGNDKIVQQIELNVTGICSSCQDNKTKHKNHR